MRIMRKIARVTATGRRTDQSDDDKTVFCEVTFINPATGKQMKKVLPRKKAYQFVKQWRAVYPIGGKHIRRSQRTENGYKHKPVTL